MGLTAAEFWELTPRQFAALWQVYLESEDRADRRVAQLAVMYANVHRDVEKHKQPFELDEFLPQAKPKAKRKRGRSSKELFSEAQQITREVIDNAKKVGSIVTE